MNNNNKQKIDMFYSWMNEQGYLPEWEAHMGKRESYSQKIDSMTISGAFAWDGSAPWLDLSVAWDDFCAKGGLNA